MSRNEPDLDPLPDEPPPPYEPLEASAHAAPSSAPPTSSAATSSAVTAPSNGVSTGAGAASVVSPQNTSNAASASHNPFLAPEEQRPSVHAASSATASLAQQTPSTNPFLNAVSPQPTGGAASANTTASSTPALPPRTYAAPSTTSPPVTPSMAEPSRPSIESHHSRHSRHSSNAAPLSPPLTSPSVYTPPTGPPPPSSSSSSQRPSSVRPNDSYRPTTVPTPGQPLLRKGKLLVYPRNWPGCPKCHDTGYKHGDPNNAHKSCWDKYGKTYTSAMSYSVGLNDATSNFQKPLPVLAGPSGMPPRPSHGHVPGGYPGAGGRPPPPAQAYGGYGGYAPPSHAPGPVSTAAARPPRTPTTPTVDAETEGGRMSDVPPNYQDASNVSSNERLPSQYVPPPMPPPGHPGSPPQPRPPHGPPHGAPGGYGYGAHAGPPGGFVGGFGPNPGGPNPYVSVQPAQAFYGARPPPPGALVVMPGDPRIGGRLCFECGGRGMTESFWFGDETCYRCRGSGRIF